MSYLSVDNIIGVQPTTTSSTFLQANVVDVYNGTTNYTHITSVSTAAPNNLIIPDANGYFVATTGSQTIQSKMLHSQQGSQTDPSYSFLGNTNTGLFRDTANTIGITCGGTKRMSISDTNIISVLPITATIFQATSGTFPTCAYTNSTNNQTGLYFGTTTTCGIACNGNAKFTFGSSANTSFQQITIPDGTAGSPSLNFSSYPTTGIGSGGGATPTLYLTTNGSIRAQLNSNGVYFPTQVQAKDGASNDPGLSFVNEQGSGLLRKSAGDLRFSVQSTDSLGIQQNGILLYGSTAGNNALYAPSKLSYYEEGTNFNITWSHGNATSVVVSAFCTRVGRVVVFYTNDIIFNTFATNTPITIQSSASIPARFRPTLSPIGFFGAWGNDQAGNYDNWFAFVQSDGSITMYPRAYGSSNAKFWIYGFCGTWII